MTEKQKRAFVAERAKNRCEYCACPESYSPASFDIEHIVPRSRGGGDELPNLAWLCSGCNNHKGVAVDALDLSAGLRVPLHNPREQSWTDNFEWSDDVLMVVGTTSVGRATIERLQMNRIRVMNLRLLLREFGLHPPLL